MKKFWLIFCTFLVAGAWAAHASLLESYGWEDGQGTLVGSYGNVGSATVVSSPDPVRSGNYALSVVEDPMGSTPQAFLAFVEGLTDGDVVNANFWGYDDTPNGAPSLRIWGHYALSGDVDSYSGSAGGNNDYTGTETLPNENNWYQVGYSWTFDSDGGTRDALVIEARLYSDETNMLGTYFIDDLTVEVPETAGIVLPVNLIPEPGSFGLVALGLLAGFFLRRRGN